MDSLVIDGGDPSSRSAIYTMSEMIKVRECHLLKSRFLLMLTALASGQGAAAKALGVDTPLGKRDLRQVTRFLQSSSIVSWPKRLHCQYHGTFWPDLGGQQ